MTEQKLLDWLRSEIKLTRRSINELDNKKLKELTDEDLVLKDYFIGQLFAYEDVIKKIKGIDEREYRLQKKRNTL